MQRPNLKSTPTASTCYGTRTLRRLGYCWSPVEYLDNHRINLHKSPARAPRLDIIFDCGLKNNKHVISVASMLTVVC